MMIRLIIILGELIFLCYIMLLAVLVRMLTKSRSAITKSSKPENVRLIISDGAPPEEGRKFVYQTLMEPTLIGHVDQTGEAICHFT